MQVDRESPLPLYVQVRHEILRRIEAGDFQAGEALPTDKQLEEHMGVSSITIRRALGQLESMGYVTRRAGRGTFVNKGKITHLSGKIAGVSSDLQAQGFRVRSHVLRHERRVPEEDVLEHLRIAQERELLCDSRVILAQDEPFALVHSFHDVDENVAFTKEEIEGDFILRLLRSKYGIEMRRARRTIEARGTEPYEAELLHVDAGAAVLQAELLVYDTTHAPLSFVRAIYRGDRYRYHEEIEP